MEGALHGLETFAQLILPGAEGFEVASVHIEDHPRFPWRGLMIDCSRHWMPIEVIERNLDAMAAVKLNVLHWHLSDDQGFRVESKRFPRLQQLGSDGHFYTQDQVTAHHRVCARSRDSRGSGIRHARPHHQLVRGISRTGERAGTLFDRAQLGDFSTHHGSLARRNLQIPRQISRRDDRAVSRSITSTSAATKWTRRNGSNPPSIQAFARAAAFGNAGRPAGVFHPPRCRRS